MSVYGTKGAKGGLISFSVDGASPVQVDRSDKDTACDFSLFTQNGLPYQQHTLTATFVAETVDLATPGVQDSVFSIQRITYQNSGPASSSPATSSSPYTSPYASPSPSASSSPASKSGAPIGPIIGGAAGGVLLIALAFGIWLILRRRGRSQTTQVHLDAEPPQMTHYSTTGYPAAGFVPGDSGSQMQPSSPPSSAPYTANSQSALLVHNNSYNGNNAPSSSASDSKYTRESTPLTMTTNPDTRRMSGVNEQVTANLDELVPPPAYDEAGPSSGARDAGNGAYPAEKRQPRPLPTQPAS